MNYSIFESAKQKSKKTIPMPVSSPNKMDSEENDSIKRNKSIRIRLSVPRVFITHKPDNCISKYVQTA